MLLLGLDSGTTDNQSICIALLGLLACRQCSATREKAWSPHSTLPCVPWPYLTLGMHHYVVLHHNIILHFHFIYILDAEYALQNAFKVCTN